MTTYNTLNPVPSADARDRYDNSQVFDEYVNSAELSTPDRLGVERLTWAGIERAMADAIRNAGYVYIGDYQAGLTVSAYNQVFRYAGEFWKAAPGTTLPYVLTGVTGTDLPNFVSVGDATLRSQLAASNGTGLLGFGSRTLLDKLGEHVSCKDAPFNCKGDGVTDDTAGMQAFLDYLAAQTISGPTTSGSLTAAYSGTSPTGFIPYGTYRLSSHLNVGSYIRLVGQDSVLKQITDSEDIFDITLYQFHMEGLQFVGGRHHLRIHNDNINSSMFSFHTCQFFLSRSFSIKTLATGGVWTHLSANGNGKNCRWISCNQIIDNCCDNMVLEENWYQPDLTNLTAGTAQFVNKGATALDPGPQTRLRIVGGFGIPAVGTYGVDRPAGIRWADNYGSFISEDVRWGGEFGGMRIVDHLAALDPSFPWNTTEVSVTGGVAFCGASNDPGAAIMGLQNAVPNRTVMGHFSGTVSSPLIANLSSMNIDAYMSAFETAQSRKAYDYFKLDLEDVITDVRAYAPLRPMIPDGLYPYLVKGRRTMIQRVTDQLLLKGAGVNNPITFTSATFDTVGAFKIATPTRIYMPNGCNELKLEINVEIDASDNTSKAVRIQIRDSGGSKWKDDIRTCPANTTFPTDALNWETTVIGPPDSWWDINITHGAATDRNLKSAKVIVWPVNMII